MFNTQKMVKIQLMTRKGDLYSSQFETDYNPKLFLFVTTTYLSTDEILKMKNLLSYDAIYKESKENFVVVENLQ